MKWGPYQLDTLVHEGGSGLILRGKMSGQICAIKVVLGDMPFSDQKLKRLNRAASLTQHLISLDRVIRLPSALVLQSRFYEGVNLKALLREQLLSVEARVAVVQQIVDALIVLHEAGLAHTDLRSENIMVTRAGRVVLLDVDQSIEIDSPADTRGRARVGLNAITPEHVNGHELSVKSDIFALASLCIELFAERSPLLANGELDYAQLNEPIVPESAHFHWFPESKVLELVELLASYWKSDPNSRPDSLESLRNLLGAALPDSSGAHSELAAGVAQQYRELPIVPINFTLPQFVDKSFADDSISKRRFRLLGMSVLAAALVVAALVNKVMFSREPLHPTLQWNLESPVVAPYIRDIRLFVDQEWKHMLSKFGRDASSHRLSWSDKGISIAKIGAGRRVFVDCGRDLCVLSVASGDSELGEVWHEPIPIGASKKRWEEALRRAVSHGD